MSAQDLEQRARELLAAEYERDGRPSDADFVNLGLPVCDADIRALRAIVAALRQQPAPVDLEQFREAVEQWKMLAQVGETVEAMPVAFRKKPEEYTARIAEADRLLSIIDSAPVEFRNYGNSEAEFIADHADSCTACGGSGHKADQQPAPVVDDAMRELIDAADKAKRAYWLARNSAAGLTNYCEESANSRRCERELDEAERIYRDSGFEAAIARAQGVQS